MVSSGGIARQLLETVPLVMRTIRAEMRSQRTADLSVPQFRALGFIDRNDGASLSDLAEHMGLTLPTVSKLVDGLVARGLVGRRDDQRDRRRAMLRITPAGHDILAVARKKAQQSLGRRLAALSRADQAVVLQAMVLLHGVFTGGPRMRRDRNEATP